MAHELKTLEDVARVVNEENIKVFLVDFEAWLRVGFLLKAVKESVGEKVLIDRDPLLFKWIDDGKNDIHVKFEVKKDESSPTARS